MPGTTKVEISDDQLIYLIKVLRSPTNHDYDYDPNPAYHRCDGWCPGGCPDLEPPEIARHRATCRGCSTMQILIDAFNARIPERSAGSGI